MAESVVEADDCRAGLDGMVVKDRISEFEAEVDSLEGRRHVCKESIPEGLVVVEGVVEEEVGFLVERAKEEKKEEGSIVYLKEDGGIEQQG